MKKMIALMMALAIIASFAACGNKEEEPTTVPTTEQTVEDTTGEKVEEDITGAPATIEELEIVETTTAQEIMEYLWLVMGAERQPAVIGGHFSAEYTHGPYTYDLTYAEDLAATLLLPEDNMAAVIDAATAVHMLNANSMTAGVVKLEKGTDVQAFADATAERISNNQWMCGFPEKLVIIQINEDYLFVSYGLAELLDPMVEGMGSSWNVNELHNQPLE